MRMAATQLPKLPDFAMSSAFVKTVMLERRWTSATRLAINSWPLRSCGYIVPKRPTQPPSSCSFSTRKTSRPTSDRPIAARRPVIPPPTTSAFCVVSTTSGSSGSVSRVRAMPPLTRLIARWVAPAVSSVWAHESCSRMFTCVYW